MEKYRIIIDTNLWISLLIGKRLSELRSLCNSDKEFEAILAINKKASGSKS